MFRHNYVRHSKNQTLRYLATRVPVANSDRNDWAGSAKRRREGHFGTMSKSLRRLPLNTSHSFGIHASSDSSV